MILLYKYSYSYSYNKCQYYSEWAGAGKSMRAYGISGEEEIRELRGVCKDLGIPRYLVQDAGRTQVIF